MNAPSKTYVMVDLDQLLDVHAKITQAMVELFDVAVGGGYPMTEESEEQLRAQARGARGHLDAASRSLARGPISTGWALQHQQQLMREACADGR